MRRGTKWVWFFCTIAVAALALLAYMALRAGLTQQNLAASNRRLDTPTSFLFKQNEFNHKIQRLKEALSQATITIGEDLDTPEQRAAFSRFHQVIRKNYPLVFSRLEVRSVGDSVLLKWNGNSKAILPFLFLAHQDVVPIATPSAWHQPPFAAIEGDGFIWARGALDMKSALVAMLESLEFLLEQNVSPSRTLYFAFGHDEETGGQNGARKMAELLRREHIHFDSVFDEGLTILKDVMPGLPFPVALVGIAQKGFLTVQLKTHAKGGHSSLPPKISAIGELSQGLVRLEKAPFQSHLIGPVRSMLETVAPYESFLFRFLFSNLWLTEPVLLSQFSKNSQTAALIHTTTAETMMSAGVRDNVLPEIAVATVNFRLLPGDTVASTLEEIKVKLEDPSIEVIPQLDSAAEASRSSQIGSVGFRAIRQAVHDQFTGTLVAPSLMVGSADCRHYDDLTENTYRFMPLNLSRSELSELHGDNEKISTDNYQAMLNYYLELIQLSMKSD